MNLKNNGFKELTGKEMMETSGAYRGSVCVGLGLGLGIGKRPGSGLGLGLGQGRNAGLNPNCPYYSQR